MRTIEPITIFTPVEGATVNHTFTVTGEASTFEANVGLRLIDPTGDEEERTSTTASEGAPGRGTWRFTFHIPPTAPGGRWIVEAFEASAKDGSITFKETRVLRIT